MSVDLARAHPHIDKLSKEAMGLAQEVSATINAVTITRAMQIGYLTACRDHGLPEPDMEDPAVTLGLGGIQS